MFRIQKAEFIAPGIKRSVIEARRIAKKYQAGQFLILRLEEHGERIPLTIESANPNEGTVSIVVQSVGKTTYQLNALEAGDEILDVVGPLGKPSEIENFGTVVVVGGGVGTALAYPTTAALKKAGNRVPFHRRRTQSRPGDPGRRNARRERLIVRDHGRRKLRRKGTGYRQTAEGARLGRKHTAGAGGWAHSDDESGGGPDARKRSPHSGEPESHHDRWHRDVWRLPRISWRKEPLCLRGWNRSSTLGK